MMNNDMKTKSECRVLQWYKGLRKNRVKTLALILLILSSAVLAWATLHKGHGWGGDFASYIMQARSVVEGTPEEFIEQNRFTVENSENQVGFCPVAYPWGTPVLLAPLYAIFGLSPIALKSLNVACFLLFLAAMVFFLRERHPYPLLFPLVSLFALNPVLLSFLNRILSDIPFLLFSTISLFLIGRTVIERRPLISNTADHFLIGLLLAISVFIRMNGILLVFALAGTHVIKLFQHFLRLRTKGQASVSNRNFSLKFMNYDFKEVLINIFPYFVFFIIILAWGFIFPRNTYDTSLWEFVSFEAIKKNLIYYFNLPARFFWKFPHHYLLYIATMPLLLAGIIRSIKRDYQIILYLLLTFSLYVLLPFTQGLRYFFPILPFYIHFVFIGIFWGFNFLKGVQIKKCAQLITACLLIIVTFYFAKNSTYRAYSNLKNHRTFFYGPFTETSREMFAFIRENTPEDAVLVFFRPRVMRMLTDRRSVGVSNLSELKRGSHLCVYLEKKVSRQPPVEAIEKLAESGGLIPVYGNPDFRLYRIQEPCTIQTH